MKEQPGNNSSSQFLKTDGGKITSNSIKIPSISFPRSGSTTKGIDEKFSVRAVNGNALFSKPLPFSPVRATLPTLGLLYNSGDGNGVFGLGWDLSFLFIKRKTNKRLTQYSDDPDSDTFLFPKAKDLVMDAKCNPFLRNNPTGNFSPGVVEYKNDERNDIMKYSYVEEGTLPKLREE